MQEYETPVDVLPEELDEQTIAELSLALQPGLDDTLKTVARLHDRHEREAYLEDHQLAAYADWVVKALAHVPAVYGYNSGNKTLQRRSRSTRAASRRTPGG